MSHLHVVQAHAVIAHPTHYPEVVVAHAQTIIDWSDRKRKAVQWLWSHRSMFHLWLRSRFGKSRMEQNRAGTRALSSSVSRETLNEFHKAYNYLGRTQTDMGLTMVIFASLLKMLACENIAMMYKYFSCCNAKRVDTSLEPVAFLRWVNSATGIEVLAWRLLKLSRP